MKRMISVLTVAALMVAMLVGSAMPAFADAKPQADDNNCQGNTVSHISPELNPGQLAKLVLEPDDFGNAGDVNKYIKDFCQSI